MHDIGHGQQAPAESSYRVEKSEIALREPARLKERHRKGVAQGHGHCGAGCGSQVEGAGLLRDRYVQNDIRPRRKG